MLFHTFFGIDFIRSSYKGCLGEIEGRIKNHERTLIVTPNPEMLYDAYHDTSLQTILKNASIAVPDGAGVFVGYQIVDSGLPICMKYLMLPIWCIRAILHSTSFTQRYGERITGSRLTPDILTLAAKNHIGVSIIDPVVNGESPSDILKRESQKNMQSIIESRYPGIQCDIIISDDIEPIKRINPIVIATHGGGKQEKILSTVMTYPEVLLCIGVGGSIDLLTGFRGSAPSWAQKFGLEWLYRLYKNPKKHLKRIKRVIAFLVSCLQGKN